jgi:hypothetical protein
MQNLFPPGVGITQVRGILKVIKEHSGTMEMSQLAEEIEEEVDDLLPIIKAAKLLGFVITKKDDIIITKEVDNIALKDINSLLEKKLPDIEPFKTIFQALKINPERSLTTVELANLLQGKGIRVDEPEASNEDMLKRLLLHWAVRPKFLSYDPKSDIWTYKG